MGQQLHKWLLPSRYVPTKSISLGKLEVESGGRIIVSDNWNRKIPTGSIIATEDGLNGLLDNWVYFHSLLFNAPLMLQTFQSWGHSAGDFTVTQSEDSSYFIEEEIDYDNVATAIYGDSCNESIKYKSAYQSYLEVKNNLISAIKNYFLAYDINHNKTLRFIDPSYWQIVMYVSVIESLLPEKEFCKGKCNHCNGTIVHPLLDPAKELKKILFSKIKDRKIRSEYHSIIYDVAKKVRNNTVHNGLSPSVGIASLAEGTTKYETKDALKGYESDRYSLELFVEQLQQICRYLLLNEIIKLDIFPPLKGFNVHSVKIKPTKSK